MLSVGGNMHNNYFSIVHLSLIYHRTLQTVEKNNNIELIVANERF